MTGQGLVCQWRCSPFQPAKPLALQPGGMILFVSSSTSGSESPMALKTGHSKSAPTSSRGPATASAAKPAASAASAGKSSTASAAAPLPVTSKHLAAKLAERHGLAKEQAETVLDGVIALFVEHLKAGDRLRIAGFGMLEVKDRPARTGRNPATGASMQIAAGKRIAFRPGKELKAAI